MYDFSDYVAGNNNFWDKLSSNAMYQCIMQWLMLALLLVILILAIMILAAVKKGNKSNPRANMSAFAGSAAAADRIYFCKKCGNQCSAADVVCPQCGTKRI